MTISTPFKKTRSNIIWFLLAILFAIAFTRTAWVCEDAFITLRTVDNFLNGYGLVWNVGERVQTFTHPLWLTFITSIAYVTNNHYASLIAASFTSLMLSLALIRATRQEWSTVNIIAIASLLWSRSFIDYSSSGLENPLTHLLLAIFSLIWLRPQTKRTSLWLSLLASGLYLNRPDSIVLIAPALVLHCFKLKEFRNVICGALPAIAWTVFSLFYYGTPIPNTALAKVATGLSIETRFDQTLNYLNWTLENDPITIIIITTGIVSGLTNTRLRPISAGLLLWVVYLSFVGADYMGGRFLSGAAFISAIVLAHSLSQRVASALTLALVLSGSILGSTLASPSDFSNRYIDEYGIADERGFYYSELGMIPTLARGTWVAHPWFKDGALAKIHPGVYTRCAIGMTGYTSGPAVYIIDPLALADPFLARLPSRPKARVGHYERAFPDGYLLSRIEHQNRIKNPALKALFDDVVLVTQGHDLWSAERLHAIWRLNTGRHQAASAAHDRDAIGLPGHPRITSDIQSCYGIPYGWDSFYRLEGNPVRAVDILNKPYPPSP